MEWLRRRLASFMARRSDRQLGILERGPLRRIVLATLPMSMRAMFRPKVAAAADGTIEFRLRRPGGGVDYMEISVFRGACSIHPRASDWPTAVIDVGVADLLRMAAGAVATPSLVTDHRLRINGDMIMIMRFPTLFGLPTHPLVQPPRPA